VKNGFSFLFYLDTSAALKLFTLEPQSPAMRDFFAENARQMFSSTLLITELVGNLVQLAPEQVPNAEKLTSSLLLVNLDQTLLRSAATIMRTGLRTLDSIHLAALQVLGSETSLVTYDKKLSAVAISMGIEVSSPGITSEENPSA
jgi:predicted nucleic acid-binding protein